MNFKDIGRLTKKPELKYTQNNNAVCEFKLAIDDYDDTTFLKCVAWKKTAEYLVNYSDTGDFVMVEGVLKIDTYEHKEYKIKMNNPYINVSRLVLPNYRKKEEQDVEKAREKRLGQRVKQKDIDVNDTFDPDLPF